ncbi:hypothetical protein AB0I39_01425 [Kitasatospora purpeofusca]|uniref:hypothetical protein n=1 Tax=Kitasatospora purpeofusca TaxID=67352 RepID=UPI0033F6C307
MSTLTSEADAAHALMMLLAEHPTLPQPEFELYDDTDTGTPDWGVYLVVRDLALFERWRAALGLDPDDISYRACHHGACLVALGEHVGVPVELFAVINVPAK